jgi:L-iditol 2-dehydrogenase
MWAYTLVQPYAFERQEVAMPTEDMLGGGQVLLRTLAGGICGSDLPLFAGAPPLPNATQGATEAGRPGSPMHEVAGEVIASRHPNLRHGSRVVGWASGANAIAEYIVTDGMGLYEYNPKLSATQAIILQPLACVINALERVPGIEGATAAVIGQGPIGVLFSHVLKSLGAASVTGIDRVDRSDVAYAFGMDRFVHSSSTRWAQSITNSEDRPEVVVEAVGHQIATISDAVAAIADGGRIYYFGIPDETIYPFPLLSFLRKNATLMAGTTTDKIGSLEKAAAYLSAHPKLAGPYMTHEYSVRDVQAAYQLACRPSTGQLKVVVDMEQ